MPQGLSLSNFRAVLFDVDGTLVDSLKMIIIGLGDTYEKYLGHRPAPQEIQSLIGMPLRRQLALYREVEPTEEELAEMSEYTLSRFEANVEHETLFSAAVDMLRLCHQRGIKTALVTSKDSQELSGFMKRFPGAPFVDTTVCASDVQHPKPAPESAYLACQRLGVSPQEAVFIGDSVYDMRCAKGAGTASVAVAYGAATEAALLAEQPDLLFRTPEELFRWAEAAFLRNHAPKEEVRLANRS